MSARESTGASLMPSPTKASFAFGSRERMSSSTFSTLSPGMSPLQALSMPRSRATLSATRSTSPVSMTVSRTPHFLSSATASRAVGFSTSEMTMCPAYSPSMAMWIIVPTLWHSM